MAKPNDPVRKPKLPAKQLAILAIARFAEPLALTSVFPYLPEMIQSFGIPKNDVAKWAGITSAVFSFAQSLTAVVWGRASDQFGRKPTIIIGLCSTMVCFLIWGLSTSLPMAIAARAIQGGGNGNVGIIRTMVAEMVPEKELQPRAFSIMPLVWSVGSVFGPAFGGFFAKPAQRFPTMFDNEFFRKFPFFLPNFVAAVFFLISVATATLFLKETLEHRRHHQDWGLVMGKRLVQTFRLSPRQRRRSFMDGEATAPLVATKISTRRRRDSRPSAPTRPEMSEVFTSQSSVGLVTYTFLALHSVAYDQILPVFLNYPVQKHTSENTSLPFRFSGGFGLESRSIGTIFTIYGITCGLIQFIVFPPLCSAFGVRNCYRACSIIFPFVYVITPYTVLIDDEGWRRMALLAIMFVKAFAVIVGFPAMTIMLTNSASSLRVLGTLNGVATTFSAIGRAVGPAMAGAAYSWGADHGYVITSWWLLAVIAAIGVVPAFMIHDGDGPSQSVDNSDGEDDDDTANDALADSGVVFRDDAAIESDSEDFDLYTTQSDASAPLLSDSREGNRNYDALRVRR